jgi:hypothetical protein
MLGMFRFTLFFKNFMSSYLNFISLLKSLSRLTKNPKSDAVWDKFCTQIRVATQAEKIINDTKLNKA